MKSYWCHDCEVIHTNKHEMNPFGLRCSICHSEFIQEVEIDDIVPGAQQCSGTNEISRKLLQQLDDRLTAQEVRLASLIHSSASSTIDDNLGESLAKYLSKPSYEFKRPSIVYDTPVSTNERVAEVTSKYDEHVGTHSQKASNYSMIKVNSDDNSTNLLKPFKRPTYLSSPCRSSMEDGAERKGYLDILKKPRDLLKQYDTAETQSHQKLEASCCSFKKSPFSRQNESSITDGPHSANYSLQFTLKEPSPFDKVLRPTASNTPTILNPLERRHTLTFDRVSRPTASNTPTILNPLETRHQGKENVHNSFRSPENCFEYKPNHTLLRPTASSTSTGLKFKPTIIDQKQKTSIESQPIDAADIMSNAHMLAYHLLRKDEALNTMGSKREGDLLESSESKLQREEDLASISRYETSIIQGNNPIIDLCSSDEDPDDDGFITSRSKALEGNKLAQNRSGKLHLPVTQAISNLSKFSFARPSRITGAINGGSTIEQSGSIKAQADGVDHSVDPSSIMSKSKQYSYKNIDRSIENTSEVISKFSSRFKASPREDSLIIDAVADPSPDPVDTFLNSVISGRGMTNESEAIEDSNEHNEDITTTNQSDYLTHIDRMISLSRARREAERLRNNLEAQSNLVPSTAIQFHDSNLSDFDRADRFLMNRRWSRALNAEFGALDSSSGINTIAFRSLMPIPYPSDNEFFQSLNIVCGLSEVAIKDLRRERFQSLSYTECPICLDDFKMNTENVKLACGHLFCFTCISDWLRLKASCPTCRCLVSREPAIPPIV